MDRLRHRADFVAAAKGPRANRSGFVLQHRLRDDDGPIRVGFTVTKKVGTATERNRLRRRLRAAAGLCDPAAMAAHSDYVIAGRRAALSLDFALLRDDLNTALRRLTTPRPRPE